MHAHGHLQFQAVASFQHNAKALAPVLAQSRLAQGRVLGPASSLGMSTEKYVNLTGTSRATAYREFTELAELGLLLRTGQGRGTRYQLVV